MSRRGHVLGGGNRNCSGKDQRECNSPDLPSCTWCRGACYYYTDCNHIEHGEIDYYWEDPGIMSVDCIKVPSHPDCGGSRGQTPGIGFRSGRKR